MLVGKGTGKGSVVARVWSSFEHEGSASTFESNLASGCHSDAGYANDNPMTVKITPAVIKRARMKILFGHRRWEEGLGYPQ